MLCGQARALVPRSLPRGGGDIAGWRAGSRARARPVVAKRSAKKRQARKLEKRDDARTMEKLAEERAARLAAAEKYRPPPPPPPTDPKDAKDRMAERERDFQMALARVGEAKAAARESERWDPSRGYKPFDDVQDAVHDLALAKTAVYESHLELALSLLTVAKGGGAVEPRYVRLGVRERRRGRQRQVPVVHARGADQGQRRVGRLRGAVGGERVRSDRGGGSKGDEGGAGDVGGHG